MKNRILLFLTAVLLMMSTTSCVVTHHIHYKPVVKEGNVQPADGAFAVKGDGFTLTYNVNGRVMIENQSDKEIYIDMNQSCMVDTMGVRHAFCPRQVRLKSSLKSEAKMYGVSGAVTVVPEMLPTPIIGINPHTTAYLPYPALSRPDEKSLQNEEGSYTIDKACSSHIMCYTTEETPATWDKLQVSLTADRDQVTKGNKGFTDAAGTMSVTNTNSSDVIEYTKLTKAGKGSLIGILGGVVVIAIAIPLIMLLK